MKSTTLPSITNNEPGEMNLATNQCYSEKIEDEVNSKDTRDPYALVSPEQLATASLRMNYNASNVHLESAERKSKNVNSIILKEEIIHLALLDDRDRISFLYVCKICDEESGEADSVSALMDHLSMEHPNDFKSIVAAARQIQEDICVHQGVYMRSSDNQNKSKMRKKTLQSDRVCVSNTINTGQKRNQNYNSKKPASESEQNIPILVSEKCIKSENPTVNEVVADSVPVLETCHNVSFNKTSKQKERPLKRKHELSMANVNYTLQFDDDDDDDIGIQECPAKMGRQSTGRKLGI